jgi:hypothetical protein
MKVTGSAAESRGVWDSREVAEGGFLSVVTVLREHTHLSGLHGVL